LDALMRLYWEIGKRAFQRQLAYRTANLAGLITNSFFGYVRAAIFVAAYAQTADIGGYSEHDAVTYTWVTQSIIMVVVLWGWWDVESTIRSGQVVSDLSKPFSYLGFWLARDYGRAVYFVLFRCAPILLAGQLLFGLRWPQSPWTWLLVLASLALAVTLSFCWRFMINLSAFWLLDARGTGQLLSSLVLFLSGFVIPIRMFPDWLRDLALALPFAGISQTPADLFLERLPPAPALASLALQALWTLIFLAAAQVFVTLATRRVVVQGG
jgi:ABC-2 type transport system permease protein